MGVATFQGSRLEGVHCTSIHQYLHYIQSSGVLFKLCQLASELCQQIWHACLSAQNHTSSLSGFHVGFFVRRGRNHAKCNQESSAVEGHCALQTAL